MDVKIFESVDNSISRMPESYRCKDKIIFLLRKYIYEITSSEDVGTMCNFIKYFPSDLIEEIGKNKLMVIQLIAQRKKTIESKSFQLLKMRSF